MKKRMDSVSPIPPNRCHVEEIVRERKKGSGTARDLRHIPEKVGRLPTSPIGRHATFRSGALFPQNRGWPPFSCGVPNQSTNVIERTTQWDMFETFRSSRHCMKSEQKKTRPVTKVEISLSKK
ncbi:hypothetical protein TNCV_2713111 [Trichonephila clavipes]|nr:hypothetical protein TNCV_2713111 [Trichonephila clavipes]